MKVEKTLLENRVLKLLVEATAEETEEARRIAIRRLGKSVRVPGFRPGKAPVPILMKHLDPVSLQEETIEVFLDTHYPQILEQEEIEPFAQGVLKSVLNLEPLTLEIHIPLQPLVEIGDYHSIRLPYDPPTVSEEDVNNVLERIRRDHAVVEPVSRPIQIGDLVSVDLIGYVKENGEPTGLAIIKRDNHILEIVGEENRNGEFPFQGFSSHLIGKQVDDRISIDHNYSEETKVSAFKGKDIRFEVTVKEIKSQVLPELNDEFAQSVGDYSTLDELRASIRSILERETLEEYHEEYDTKALEELINLSKFEYPLELVEKEREAYLESFSRRLSPLNIDLDLYKKIRGLSDEEFEKQVDESVEYRIKSSLALVELAKKEKIRIDTAKVFEDTQLELKEVYQNSKSRIPKQMVEDIAAYLTERNTMDQIFQGAYERLRQIAKGEVQPEIAEGQEESQPEEISSDHQAVEETQQDDAVVAASETEETA